MILDIDELNHAVNAIDQGGVIAYPTETVWGLGCCPWKQEAVQRLLEIKQRPPEKGLILIGVSEDQFEPLLTPLSPDQRKTLAQSWPGPHTWIVPDPDGWTPEWVRGEHHSVAIRVCEHPIVRYLCAAMGTPLVSTSANQANNPPLLTQHEVEKQFAAKVDFIAPGECSSAKPSEIRNLTTGEVIRAG